MKLPDSFKEFISSPDRVFNAISIFLAGSSFGVILSSYIGLCK